MSTKSHGAKDARGARIARWAVTFAALGAACIMPAGAQNNKQCEDNFIFANQLLDNTPPDYSDAIDTYKQVLQQCPTFAQGDLVDQNLAFAYLHLKPPQVEKAVAVLEEGVAKYPNSGHIGDLKTALGTALMNMADQANKAGKTDAAKDDYTKAIPLLRSAADHTTDPALKSQLLLASGNAQFNVGEYAAAAASYHDLVATNPPANLAAPAMYNMGNAWLNEANRQGVTTTEKTNAYTQASTAFEQLVTKYPTDANVNDAKLQLAKIAFQQDKYDQAAQYFGELVNDPKSSHSVKMEAMNGEAFARVNKKNPTKADYDKAIELLTSYVNDGTDTDKVRMDAANVQLGYLMRTQSKDLDGALKHYRLAMKSDNADVRKSAQAGEVAVAVAYFNQKDYAKALPIYDSLTDVTDPKVKEDVMYGRALTLVSLKDPKAESALSDFVQAYPKASGSANAAYQLGVMQYNAKQYPTAAQTFTMAAAAARPDEKNYGELKTESLYWAGQAYEDAKQSTEAVAAWKEGIAADPTFKYPSTGDTLVGLGLAYSDMNQPDQAQTYLSQAVKNYSDNPSVANALLTAGVKAFANKKYDLAASSYKMVESIHSTNPDVLKSQATAQYDLGITYLQVQPPRLSDALSAFQAYLAANPTGEYADKAYLYSAEGYEGVASAATGDAKKEAQTKAIAAYQQAMNRSKDPDNQAHAAWKAAALEGDMGETDKAVADLSAAIARFPNSKDAGKMAFEKGHLYQTAKQSDKALAAFQAYLAAFPTGPDAPAAHFNAAVIEYNNGVAHYAESVKAGDTPPGQDAAKQAKDDYVKAAADFDAAVNSPKADTVPLGDAYFYQGFAYGNSDQPDKAVAAFEKVLTAKPAPADPNSIRIAKLKIGEYGAEGANPDQAIGYLKEFLATNPKATDNDTLEANLALGKAYSKKGDCTNALPALDNVVNNTDTELAAEALYYEGLCQEGKGQTNPAKLKFLKVKLTYPLAKKWVELSQKELDKIAAAAPAQ